ncbi:MAG: 2-oxo acid dehydrogenase subunit E2, partial [Gemmatimonadota bacterium]|nr:2-oxo acid dehydrogenase subunit E2 [Gemmatimonadota bacterium]
MATKVHMEALSPTMEEGQLVQWLKGEGDAIANGDLLAEIETDKATMELVARGEGLLRKIFLDAGGIAEVGSVIAVIAAADEDISGIEGVTGGAAATAPADETAAPTAPEPAPQAVSAPPAVPPPETSAPAVVPPASPVPGGRIKASPLARRLAEEMGVDITRVSGSGPGGRVVKRDVETAKAAGVAAPVAAPATWASDGAEYEDVPTSQMRKAIAKRLVTSIGPVPTFYLTVDVDMGRVMEARKSINTMLEKNGMRISINDILLKAIAGALRQHANCNAQWHDGFVRRFNSVHLGVAVAIEDGLITPVVKNAHAKGIAQISAEVRELAGRAREKKLLPDEYT